VPVKRDNPYASFNFVVQIDGIDGAAFSEAHVGGGEVGVVEYREGGDRVNTTRKLPGLVRYANVVLRRGVVGDDTLFGWFRELANGVVDRRAVAIVLLDESRQPVATWRLRNAWPVKWEGPALDARANEVAMETLELAHEGIEYE
jgi:phage tail-like protein